jgi:hypothetical protein
MPIMSDEMLAQRHAAHPELWFRASARVPYEALYAGICSGTLTASLRVGRRDRSHPKGYAPGQVVTVKLFDNTGSPIVRRVQITAVQTKRLATLDTEDFKTLRLYECVEDAARDLNYFERRSIDPQEMVSVVSYRFL